MGPPSRAPKRSRPQTEHVDRHGGEDGREGEEKATVEVASQYDIFGCFLVIRQSFVNSHFAHLPDEPGSPRVNKTACLVTPMIETRNELL